MVMEHMMVPCTEHLLDNLLISSPQQSHEEAHLLPLLCKKKPEAQKGTQSSGIRDGCAEIEIRSCEAVEVKLGKVNSFSSLPKAKGCLSWLLKTLCSRCSGSFSGNSAS